MSLNFRFGRGRHRLIAILGHVARLAAEEAELVVNAMLTFLQGEFAVLAKLVSEGIIGLCFGRGGGRIVGVGFVVVAVVVAVVAVAVAVVVVVAAAVGLLVVGLGRFVVRVGLAFGLLFARDFSLMFPMMRVN